MQFKEWLLTEEEQKQNIKKIILQVIEKLKNFKSTANKLFPTAYDTSYMYSIFKELEIPNKLWSNLFLYSDIFAVLSGSKPASITPLDLFDHSNNIKNIIINLINNSNIVIDITKGFVNSYNILIGKPYNIQNIKKAYDVLTKYPPGTTNIEIIKAHKTIGENLGFPKEEINKFISSFDIS